MKRRSVDNSAASFIGLNEGTLVKTTEISKRETISKLQNLKNRRTLKVISKALNVGSTSEGEASTKNTTQISSPSLRLGC
jgi:hypothetical protein